MLQKKANSARPADRFFRWFPWVWLVAAYGITMLVLCLHSRSYIDSDMASEMILSQILNEEGGLLSTNWWYSTELQVFCLQMLYRPALLLFPHNWFAARMLGQALFILILLVSYLYMGHGLGLKAWGAWGAAALACPFGVCYLWYGLLGGFYLPYMILLLLGFGAILHLLRATTRRQRILHWVMLLGTSAVSGLNGLKGLMAFFLPMVLAAATALAMQWHERPAERPRQECRVLGLSAVALLVAGAGFGVYSTLLAASHEFMSHSSRRWSTLDIQALVSKLADFLTLFGYPIDSSVGGDVKLFSLIGILCAFGLVTAAAIVVSLFRLLYRWRELTTPQRLAPLLLAYTCLVQGAVFAWTGELSDTSPYQWLTVIPLVFPVLQLEGETEHFRLPFTRRLAGIAFCLCFVAVSVGSSMRYFTSGYRVNPHLEEVSGWLQEEGYTQGYATFWNANVVTEWADGEIDMWSVSNFNDMEPSHWLQKASHANPPEGKVFLLTTLDELNGMGLSRLYWWSNVVYEDDDQAIQNRTKRYVVMAYDSYDQMMTAIRNTQAEGAGETA